MAAAAVGSIDRKICRKKYTIADYGHRRPKMLQRKEIPVIDPHRHQFYYGITTTKLTEHLSCKPPSHAHHPSLRDAPAPCYHKKSSSITENCTGGRVKRITPGQVDFWFNRQCTDVTEQLRFVPPAHAMGSSKSDPWFGRTRTYITNSAVDDYTIYQGRATSGAHPQKQGRPHTCPETLGMGTEQARYPSNTPSTISPTCSTAKADPEGRSYNGSQVEHEDEGWMREGGVVSM